MSFKKFNPIVSNQRGFTLVELLIVIAIVSILASIGVQAFTLNRSKSYDAQVIAMIKTLLTVSAIDEPVDNPADPGAASDNPGQGGNLGFLGEPFASVELPQNMYYRIINDGNGGTDKWQFYLAHPSGTNGYYFWIPGDACSVTDDAAAPPNVSDKIFWRPDPGQYRNMASLGVLP